MIVLPPASMLRRFAIAWAVAFAALMGVVAAFASLFPGLIAPKWSSLALLSVSLVIAAMYARTRSRAQQLAIDDILPDRPDHELMYRIECVTTRGPIIAVHELTRIVYPGVAPLPVERYEQWLLINPNIFVCLFGHDRRVLGYFDVFPLRGDFMNLLVEGRVGERDIRREHILRPRQASSASDLYLGGIAVAEPTAHAGKRNATMLLWALLNYMETFYTGNGSRSLYAEAATPEGEGLLQKFRFELVGSAKGRKDPHPLYRARLNSDHLDLARRVIPDFSNAVVTGWKPHRSRLRVTRGRVA